MNSINLPKHLWKRIKRRLFGCCLLLVLAGLLTCGALLYLVQLAAAQTSPAGGGPAPIEALLIIDNSNSMFEKNGIGSDPDLLRIRAARLFINYLGVDSGGVTHRLGVIFFGGQARLVVPLTGLTDDARRAALIQLIENPERLRWTNPQAALELAETVLQTGSLSSPTRQAVVLLTDGKPEWDTAPTITATAKTMEALRSTAERFATHNIPLFIILLQNSATDQDPQIEQLYVPLWQEMAARTGSGRFYRARESAALPDIYHDIVITLTGRQTDGVVIQTQVQTETIVKPVTVENGLAQVTFVIHKSAPGLQVEIIQPDGQALTVVDKRVQYGGQPGQSLEEIWAVSDPPAGTWLVRLSGRGSVTVWKDFHPAPATPVPTATPSPAPTTPPPPPTPWPTRTPTLLPSPTPAATATRTPVTVALATGPSPGTPVTANRLPPPANDGSGLRWIGAPLLVVVVVAGGAGWVWYRRVQRRPTLSGLLRQVNGPGLATALAPVRLDLDSLQRSTYSLGTNPSADLFLVGSRENPADVLSRLVARLDPAGYPGVALVVAENNGGPVQVNGRPVRQEWMLQDGDLIALAGYRFKYENLRLRRAAAELPRQRGQASSSWAG